VEVKCAPTELLTKHGFSVAKLSHFAPHCKKKYQFLKFRHKESGEETSVGLVYVGKVGRGERRSEGWEAFGI